MEVEDTFNAEFIFTWRIKKFSFCFPWTWVRSPTFTVESINKTRWCLQLWPKEYTNGIHMEYYLAREEADDGPEIVRVAFELSFLDHCGIQLVKKSREASFTRDKNKGFSEFVEQVVVYTYRRNEFLIEDTLIACCRMKQIGGSIQKPVFCSATTTIGVEFCSFDWNIENFSKLRPGIKRTLRKNNPSIKVVICLTLKTEGALQFEISHAHMDEPNMTDCEISVVNASTKNVIYSKRDSRYLEGKVWEFPIFVKKSQLIVEKNICLQKDVLTLKCTISISLGVISSVVDGYRSRSSSFDVEKFSAVGETISSVNKLIGDVQKLLSVERKNTKEILEDLPYESSSSPENASSSSTQSEFHTSSNESVQSQSSSNEDEFHKFDSKIFDMEEIAPTSTMKEELQRFYQDGTFSDVTLTAGNETFPAHKMILSLRSHKFKEIFLSDLSESNKKLTDLDPRTLRDLLNFIYTNNVRNMNWEKAQKLFLAAESYQVTSLKQACVNFMKENIDESNACNVLILADEQRDEEMKKLALEFIVKHDISILNTKAWDELSKKNIKLAFETMQQMYMNKT